MYNQPRPRLFLVPLEACQHGQFQLIVGLQEAECQRQISMTRTPFAFAAAGHTFFLNCLWIASNASLIVTPFRFRAVTSSPSGKCRSIFFTGGVVRNFLSTAGSSTVLGDVLSLLCVHVSLPDRCTGRDVRCPSHRSYPAYQFNF